MIRTLLQILPLALLISCFAPDKEQQSESGKTNFKTLDTTISFAGYWLSEDYATRLQKTNSPKLAQMNSEECFIEIPDRTLKQTTMIWNFHEGGALLTFVRNNQQYQLWEMQDDSITRLHKDFQIISPSKIKIGKKVFLKIEPFVSKDEVKNPLILEAQLFEGQYVANDGKKVTFKKMGKSSAWIITTITHPRLTISMLACRLTRSV